MHSIQIIDSWQKNIKYSDIFIIVKLRIFTGKGGVGKTTLCSADAVKNSFLFENVLICSVDPAHSLAHIFGCKSQPDVICKVSDTLSFIEMKMNEFYEYGIGRLSRDFSDDFVKRIDCPTFRNSGFIFFYNLMNILLEKKWKIVYIDTAATGQFFKFINLPESFIRWIGRVSANQKESLFTEDDLEILFRKTMRFRNIILDKRITEVNIVCHPAKLVFEETTNLIHYLYSSGIHINYVYINGIFPEKTNCQICRYISHHQRRYILEIKGFLSSNYPEVKIKEVYQCDYEPVGIKNLIKFARNM